MSEMVERAALAVALTRAKYGWRLPGDRGGRKATALDCEIAKAAIEATREPTEEMIEAAVTTDAAEPIHFGAYEATAMWRAMIGAAVKNA